MSFGKLVAIVLCCPFFAMGRLLAWPCLAFYYGCVEAYKDVNR